MFKFEAVKPKAKNSKLQKMQKWVKIDPEGIKIVKDAVKDLLKTKKAVYLNMINSFLNAEVEWMKANNIRNGTTVTFDHIHSIFNILNDKVSLPPITITSTDIDFNRSYPKYL